MGNINRSLIEKAQYGDAESLEILLDDFSTYAYYYAMKQLNNVYEAEECTQKALFNFAKNLHRYDASYESIYGWSKTIIVNVVKNYKRDTYIDKVTVQKNDMHVYKAVEQRESLGEFRCILSELESIIGEEQYKILSLRVVQNYRFTEISDMLNIPIRTLKRRYVKALKDAKKYFGEENEKKY